MFSSLLLPNVGPNQITMKTIHGNLYFQFSYASDFFCKPVHQSFLVNSVNAGSCMAVWILTYEVLTERRAGWHAGRRRPWRLRPEIALLLHYSITSQLTSASWLPLHHATAKMSWDGNNWMQRLWVTQPNREQGKCTETTQYSVYCVSQRTSKQS